MSVQFKVLQAFLKERVKRLCFTFRFIFITILFQQPVIIGENAKCFLLLFTLCFNSDVSSDIWLVLITGNTEISTQLLCRFKRSKTEQPCRKRDYIAVFRTAETIEMVVIQLHRRIAVIVKDTLRHSVTHRQAIMLSGDWNRHCILDSLEVNHATSLSLL